ncbi:MAG: 3-ketoacyl-ACP reductase [Chloroflexota bacterium]
MSGRVALITGGTRGIGLGIARRLAAEGWRLAINGRRPDDAVAPVVEELRASGTDVVYVRGDISLTAARPAIVDRTLVAFGRIDALVNNAGIASPGRLDFLDATEEAWDLVLDTNLKGPYFLTQAVARVMIRQSEVEPGSRCRIVTIGSINATVASVHRGDYCASKAGLGIVSRVFAVRLAEHGIDAFEIRPGLILTDMTAPVKETYDTLIADGLTLERRWGTPDDVGRAVAALLRGDLPYATGQVIVVDGGFTVDVL